MKTIYSCETKCDQGAFKPNRFHLMILNLPGVEFVHEISADYEEGRERFYHMAPEGIIVNHDSSEDGKIYVTLYGSDENISSAEKRIQEGISTLELSI